SKGATYANRRRSRGGIAGWSWNCLVQSHARFKILTRSFRGVLCSFQNMERRSERLFASASNEWIRNWTDMSITGDRFTIADITALVAIDFGGRLAGIQIAPSLAHLTRWHEAVSNRASAQA